MFTPFSCRGIGDCIFDATYTRSTDSLSAAVTWLNDGGVTTTPLGEQDDAGLAAMWDQSNASCVSQSDFSLLDDCLTHQAQISVTVLGSQSAHFEYYTGSGVQPPLTVEQAVNETVRAVRQLARDAGFDF
ncbi:MAG: hypothetical protein U0228_35235 [Myxococcaceae bacterium]